MSTPEQKERPLLMTAGNVRAMLAGRKTQTRRLITPALEMLDFGNGEGPVPAFTKKHCPPGMLAVGLDVLRKPGNSGLVRCPHGRPGDAVWIQENYSLEIVNEAKRTVRCTYLADGHVADVRLFEYEWHKLKARRTRIDRPTPGRFMYRSLSRIRRDLAEVRAELLHEITEADAWAEGIGNDETRDKPLAALANVLMQFPKGRIGPFLWENAELYTYAHPPHPDAGKIIHTTARGAYAALWAGIHGAESWSANPAVLALTFKVS